MPDGHGSAQFEFHDDTQRDVAVSVTSKRGQLRAGKMAAKMAEMRRQAISAQMPREGFTMRAGSCSTLAGPPLSANGSGSSSGGRSKMGEMGILRSRREVLGMQIIS